jgi:hypothetical protein
MSVGEPNGVFALAGALDAPPAPRRGQTRVCAGRLRLRERLQTTEGS